MRPVGILILIPLLVGNTGLASQDDCLSPVLESLAHDGLAGSWGWIDRTYTFTVNVSHPSEDLVLVEWDVNGTSVPGTGVTFDAVFTGTGGHTVTVTVTNLTSDCDAPATSHASVGFAAYDPRLNFIETEHPSSGTGCATGLLTTPHPDPSLPPPYIHSCFWYVVLVDRSPDDGLIGEIRVDGLPHHVVAGDRIIEEVTTDGIFPGEHRFQPCFYHPADKHGVEWCGSALDFLTV